MTKIGLAVILILLAGRNYAQQNYFILIQADNKQSFYVRQGSRSIPSSAEGSLILSQLKDSTYNIVIGFPGQQFPDQAFSVDLHHKDQQFILRNQADKGWVLYNPLTGETRIADLKEEKGAEVQVQGVKKDDAFSRLMAGVVHDTAVMYNTYAADPSSPSHDSLASGGLDPSRAPVHPDTPVANSSAGSSGLGTVADPGRMTAPPVVDPAVAQTDKGGNQPGKPTGQADSPAVQTAPGGAVMLPVPSKPDSGSLIVRSGSPVGAGSSLVPDSVAARADSMARRPFRQPNIVKLSERKLPHSLRLAFSDRSVGKKADTVILFIMKDTPALSNPRISNGVTATGAGSPVPPPGKALHPADTGHRVSPRINGPNPDGSVPVSGNTAGEAVKVKPDTAQKHPSAKAPLPFVNSDCHDFATDYDVDKLRVKMLAATKDEDRILAARKTFKAKCFNTRQIRALGEVFTTDALKFRFYETAYPFASDDHFRELAGTLTDPVYNSKFKAMTGQQ
jgi:hypothetical protein